MLVSYGLVISFVFCLLVYNIFGWLVIFVCGCVLWDLCQYFEIGSRSKSHIVHLIGKINGAR